MDWFRNLFRSDIGRVEITLFDGWHIGYLILIVGLIIGSAFILRKKSEKTKNTVLNVLILVAIMSYILDFFVQPLYRGEMDTDKLPFHICTILCILAGFTHFNKHFKWLKVPVVVLCVVAPLMYLTYPGSALGGVSPISYKVVQTFFYHGVLLAYGVLSLTTGSVKLNIKNVWKELLVIIAIACWAAVGNAIYSTPDHHYDWFFITGSTFPFVPKWLMPFAVVVAVFGMVLLIYGIFYLVQLIVNNHNTKQVNNTQDGSLSKDTTDKELNKN